MKYIKITMEDNVGFFKLSSIDYVCVTKNGKKKIMFNDGETIEAKRFEIVDDKYLNEIGNK